MSNTPQQSDADVRLKLLKAELPEEQMPKGATINDLTCAINVKEKIEVNGKNFIWAKNLNDLRRKSSNSKTKDSSNRVGEML
jgi:hypothetical protein